MLKKRTCLRKDRPLAIRLVLKVDSSNIQNKKRVNKCMIKKKKCCKYRIRKKRCCPVFRCPPKCRQRQRPILVPCPPRPCKDPIVPPDPPIPNTNLIIEKECCGNILIQGKQPSFQIWASDVESNIHVVQISIYSNSTSTDALNVEIKGMENIQISIPPGNTSNFVGQGIQSVHLSSTDHQHTFVEGKFNISITLRCQQTSTLTIAQ